MPTLVARKKSKNTFWLVDRTPLTKDKTLKKKFTLSILSFLVTEYIKKIYLTIDPVNIWIDDEIRLFLKTGYIV